MEKLTFTMENYLEAVYELSIEDQGTRLTDIAIKMEVTKATANTAMSVLSEKKLITNEKYHKIYLTEEGLKLAKLISGKHQVIQKFFTEVLNINNDIANTDACAIEHVISNHSITAMNNFLNNIWKKDS